MRVRAGLWLFAACAGDPPDVVPIDTETTDTAVPTTDTSDTTDTTDTTVPTTDATATITYVHDPSGYAPLSGELTVEATAPVTVEVLVPGDNGPYSDVTYTTPDAATTQVVPVLGLYPDRTQDVSVVVRAANGALVTEETVSVTTEPLVRAVHEDVEIITAELDRMTPGFTLVSQFGQGYGGGFSPLRPWMFDAFGDVRWVLDFNGHPELDSLFYDVGVERLANGNLYFGDGSTSAIYEVDMLGRVIDTWSIAPYGFHHNVQEMPNGNFLVTASEAGASTIEDQILEVDRVTGDIVNVWDLRQSLDPDRWTWSGQGFDWIHVNAVQYDESDDTIVISGRVQGVVKLTQDNEVVWILAPHVNWQTAGDGTDLSTKLLQPLDGQGQEITDANVIAGNASHPEFTWNWMQHAVQVLGGGTIALFDNGPNRHFVNDGPYSRAVKFRIDEAAMTVLQVWDYGEERGAETYSSIVSDVDVLDDGHVIWSPGAVSVAAGPNGTVIELDEYDEVLFEAKIWSTAPTYGITFHRTERLTLYP